MPTRITQQSKRGTVEIAAREIRSLNHDPRGTIARRPELTHQTKNDRRMEANRCKGLCSPVGRINRPDAEVREFAAEAIDHLEAKSHR